MGDVVTFPTHESTIAERLEALLEAAKEGVLVAFVYATMNQDGEHVYDILGEIDEPQMISTLNTLKREIKEARVSKQAFPSTATRMRHANDPESASNGVRRRLAAM